MSCEPSCIRFRFLYCGSTGLVQFTVGIHTVLCPVAQCCTIAREKLGMSQAEPSQAISWVVAFPASRDHLRPRKCFNLYADVLVISRMREDARAESVHVRHKCVTAFGGHYDASKVWSVKYQAFHPLLLNRARIC